MFCTFTKRICPTLWVEIEQVIFQLSESAARHGIDSHVLTLSTDPAPAPIQIGQHQVHQARLDLQLASTGFSFSVFKQFRELAAEADVVNYHFPWPFMDVVHFCSAIKKPCVVTYHSDIIRQRSLLKMYRPLMRRFLNSANRIVAASPNYLHTSDVLQEYREKTRGITYGLDRSAYPKLEPERLAYWRQRLPERFFLFVGVMRYYKGLHIAGRAQGRELSSGDCRRRTAGGRAACPGSRPWPAKPALPWPAR